MSLNQNPFSPQTTGSLVPVSDRQGLAGLAGYIRIAWLVYLALILSYMIAGLPLVLAQNQTACVGTGCLDWQLSPEGIQRLGQTGIPFTSYAWYSTLLPLIVPLLSLALIAELGFVIMVRCRGSQPIQQDGANDLSYWQILCERKDGGKANRSRQA
jgi:hypothetical protein